MKEAKVELSEIQTLRNHLGGGKIKDYPLFCRLLASSAVRQARFAYSSSTSVNIYSICAFKTLLRFKPKSDLDSSLTLWQTLSAL